jgi:hypothetical protein
MGLTVDVATVPYAASRDSREQRGNLPQLCRIATIVK